MAPIWPFKKKARQAPLQTPAPVAYTRGGDGQAEQALEDRTHVESSAYQDAMAALANPHLGVEETSPVVPVIVEATQPEITPSSDWLHHTDGYWYKKKADGSFDTTPHIKNTDGTLKPYS